MLQGKSRKAMYAAVLITGAVTLVVELTASRMLASYFGSSLFVWSNVIATTLLALAIGYWLGGAIADRYPTVRAFGVVIAGSGVAIALAQMMGRGVLRSILEITSVLDLAVTLGSLFSVLILFAVPLILLGFVSPFAVRLMMQDVDTSGQSAGRLYAFSTLGSIVGTFLASFVCIPFLGIQLTLALCAMVLIVVGIITQHRQLWMWVLLVVPVASYFSTFAFEKKPANIIVDVESTYQRIRVAESGERRFLIYNEGGGVQSVYDASTPFVPDSYWNYTALVPFLREAEKQRVYFLGIAGGTIPRMLSEGVGDARQFELVGSEIDPAVVRIAKTYFGLDKVSIEIHENDGRVDLQQQKKPFDMIVVDAYTKQSYIPFHVTTVEFFEQVKSKLTEKGVVAINVNARDLNSPLLQRIGASMRKAFPYLYIVPVTDTFNFLIIGALQPLSPQEVFPRTLPDALRTFEAEFVRQWREWNPSGEVLTDDKAPVELLTDGDFYSIAAEQRL